VNVKHLKPLPEDQEITVNQMYQHHPNRRYRQRAHMVLLSAQGYSQKEIARIVRVTPRTVGRYVKRYKKRGFLGLYDAPIPGRPPKVTRDIQEHIDKCLETNPREYGYNMSTWTTSLMQYHLWIRFGVKVCVETARLWFRRLDYRLIFPRYLLLDADKKEVQKAQQDIAALMERALRGEIILIFMDEATFRMVPTLTRIWAKKGSKPMIPTHDDKRKVVITGGTNPVSGKTHFYLSESASQEAALAFVKQMRRRYPDMEMVILLDGAPSHKANILKEYAEQDKKIHLKPLPKYAPKLNIQEDIWKWLRKRITHNFLFDGPKSLSKAIRDGYRYLQGHPERVLSLTGKV
jgi:transposase